MCFGTKIMKCEEILKLVDNVWKSVDNVVALSRGWMSHYQVIATSLELKWDNKYLKQKDFSSIGLSK